MKYLTVFLLTLALSSYSLAEFEIPNEFEDGQVTSASQMNENFQALKAEIEILKTQIEEKHESRTTLVGITEEKFNGAGGLAAMGKACDRMLAKSYVCQYYDLMRGNIPENISLSDAWLLDGRTTSNSSCNVFREANPGEYSWALYSNGNIRRSMPCESQIGVACCK